MTNKMAKKLMLIVFFLSATSANSVSEATSQINKEETNQRQACIKEQQGAFQEIKKQSPRSLNQRFAAQRKQNDLLQERLKQHGEEIRMAERVRVISLKKDFKEREKVQRANNKFKEEGLVDIKNLEKKLKQVREGREAYKGLYKGAIILSISALIALYRMITSASFKVGVL